LQAGRPAVRALQANPELLHVRVEQEADRSLADAAKVRIAVGADSIQNRIDNDAAEDVQVLVRRPREQVERSGGNARKRIVRPAAALRNGTERLPVNRSPNRTPGWTRIVLTLSPGFAVPGMPLKSMSVVATTVAGSTWMMSAAARGGPASTTTKPTMDKKAADAECLE